LQIQTKIVSCHTADSKPVKQEVNGTVMLPPLVFADLTIFGQIETMLIIYSQSGFSNYNFIKSGKTGGLIFSQVYYSCFSTMLI
jgi:hypothetical protein